MNNFFYHGNLIEKRIPQHTPYDTALQILQPFLQQINLIACFISVAFAATNK